MTKSSPIKFDVDGQTIELTHSDKVLFPESGFTKRDIVDYYRRIAPRALPLWRDRPVTMQRFPSGIDVEGFYQKDMPSHFPDWIDRVELAKTNGSVTHVVVNTEAVIIYLANQGCITPHLSLARSDKPHHPDRLIFDLDPSDDDFRKVQYAARLLNAFLSELDLKTFVQTTGSRGFHVMVPLDRSADFETVRTFAREVAEVLAERHPQNLTVEQRKAKRGNSVFIDYLRNAYGQTAVAPYAVRALPGAPVATPLRNEEIGRNRITPARYTIANIFRRLARIEDPWRDLKERGCALDHARRRLDAVVRRI